MPISSGKGHRTATACGRCGVRSPHSVGRPPQVCGDVVARAAALSVVGDLSADMRAFVDGMLAEHERHIAYERVIGGLDDRIRTHLAALAGTPLDGVGIETGDCNSRPLAPGLAPGTDLYPGIHREAGTAGRRAGQAFARFPDHGGIRTRDRYGPTWRGSAFPAPFSDGAGEGPASVVVRHRACGKERCLQAFRRTTIVNNTFRDCLEK